MYWTQVSVYRDSWNTVVCEDGRNGNSKLSTPCPHTHARALTHQSLGGKKAKRPPACQPSAYWKSCRLPADVPYINTSIHPNLTSQTHRDPRRPTHTLTDARTPTQTHADHMDPCRPTQTDTDPRGPTKTHVDPHRLTQTHKDPRRPSQTHAHSADPHRPSQNHGDPHRQLTLGFLMSEHS